MEENNFMLNFNDNGSKLRSLSELVSNFSQVTHSKINTYLESSNIKNMGIKSKPINGGYVYGCNKKDKIYNSFANELNASHSDTKIIDFIESVFEPSQYVNNPQEFNEMLDSANKVMLLMGAEITKDGKVITAIKATTIEEVNKRVNILKYEVSLRKLHPYVLKYCNKEYLAKDYFHADFEAVKGVCERLRDITHQNKDGFALVDIIFSIKKPLIVFSDLIILDNEIDLSEFKGIGNLIRALIQMVRNPSAHNPRLSVDVELIDCLEILTIVSRIHRYLDRAFASCYVN